MHKFDFAWKIAWGVGAGEWGYDGIIPSYQILPNVCFHNGPRTCCSFRGFRCILGGGLKLTALQKVVILFPPRDAEWKLQLMGVLCPHQQKNKSACVYAFLLLPPLNQISKCFILLLKSQKMGSFVTVHKLRRLHCAVSASTDNQGMAKLKLIKHVSQWGRLFC